MRGSVSRGEGSTTAIPIKGIGTGPGRAPKMASDRSPLGRDLVQRGLSVAGRGEGTPWRAVGTSPFARIPYPYPWLRPRHLAPGT